MCFIRTVWRFSIYSQLVLYAILGDTFGCNEEMMKKVISSEIKHLPFRLNELFDNFARDFEMIIYDNFNYTESIPGPKSQTAPSLELKFPYFSRHFKSNLRHPSFQNIFKNIVNIFDVVQNEFNKIWKNYDIFIETSLSEAREKVTNLTDKLSAFEYKLHEASGNIKCNNSDQNRRLVSRNKLPKDCFEAFAQGEELSGETTIQPHPSFEPRPQMCHIDQYILTGDKMDHLRFRRVDIGKFSESAATTQTKGMKVWCNHSYEGGNWTVILRREHQRIQLDFRRPFVDYENGFGDPEGEYWIGLRDLHHMTNHRSNELLVLMSIKSERAFAKYRHFRVGVPSGYELHVRGYDEKSTAGNSLSYHNQMLFSTFDVDRDNDEVRSCSADSGGGGFWFNFCYYANPTGVYPPGGLPQGTALNSMLEWRRWKGFHAYLSSFVMMIRPRT